MPLKILIAEDSATNRLLFSITMTRLGHLVDIAVNGREPAEMFQNARSNPDGGYDLVFLDLYMPVMTGIEAAFAIRQSCSGAVPVFAVSGLPPDDMAEKFQSVGIRRCLLKPLDREKLEEVARECGLGEKLVPAGASPQDRTPAPRRLMMSYAGELRSRADSCAELYRADDATALHREARTIFSLADMLGLPGLARIARDVESAAESRKTTESMVLSLARTCMQEAERIEAHAPPARRA
jgi:CheY-like chemotaxis protein